MGPDPSAPLRFGRDDREDLCAIEQRKSIFQTVIWEMSIFTNILHYHRQELVYIRTGI